MGGSLKMDPPYKACRNQRPKHGLREVSSLDVTATHANGREQRLNFFPACSACFEHDRFRESGRVRKGEPNAGPEERRGNCGRRKYRGRSSRDCAPTTRGNEHQGNEKPELRLVSEQADERSRGERPPIEEKETTAEQCRRQEPVLTMAKG